MKEFIIILASIIITLLIGFNYVDITMFASLANITAVFDGMIIFVISFIIATLFTAWLVVIARTTFIIRFLAIPAWLIFTISLVITIDSFLGYPYPIVPAQSELIAYKIYFDDVKHKKMIEAWMYSMDEGKSRLYKFPYTKNNEKALKRATNEGKRGKRVEIVLEGERTGTDKQGTVTKFDLNSMIKYNITHRGLPTKIYESSKEPLSEQEQETPGLVSIPGDEIVIQMPDGSSIAVPAGSSFAISPKGEISITN